MCPNVYGDPAPTVSFLVLTRHRSRDSFNMDIPFEHEAAQINTQCTLGYRRYLCLERSPTLGGYDEKDGGVGRGREGPRDGRKGYGSGCGVC